MARFITLNPFGLTQYVQGRTQGWRLRIEIGDRENIPAEIFVYQRKPLPPSAGAFTDDFVNIASPADLEEYPVNEPAGAVPFYRLAYADIIFRSQSLADEAWNAIIADVTELIRTLDLMDNLVPMQPVVIGTQSPSSSSISSS